MTNRERLFQNGKCMIGMVHCLPLPGTMGYGGDMGKIIEQAVADAVLLEQVGFDAIIVENMGDAPFAAKMDEEQKAALAVVAAYVKERVHLPVGIDAAFSDYQAGLAITNAIGAAMVRIPVFVDTVVTACGILHPCAREVVRYRKDIGAEDVLIFADIQVKHSHMLVDSISIHESAEMAAENGADAIIVTGAQIGMETPLAVIEEVKKTVSIPVIAGSGFTPQNGKAQLAIADGAIVGSSLKQGGKIANPVDKELAMAVIQSIR